MRNNTSKQERLTLYDTKNKQQIMREYLFKKISNPIVTDNDKKILPILMSDALLSQPALSKLKPAIEVKDIRIPLASDVFDLLLKILWLDSYQKQNGRLYGRFHLRRQVFEIELSELWRLLFNYCNQLSAGALAEALSRSKEKEVRKGIDVPEFSKDEDSD